ncbi:cyclophilin-like fold protein [Vibrio viridaestus]|uniref:cyclophilin-like fold protein n=1 Tax=Vibrio viridaestus TaxID=2487322 RepID=UPI0014083B47|nr:cyclophilin-like fold protein [Vibrio viridaestus]
MSEKSVPITLTIDSIVITATLDNSQTSKEFLATLPRTMSMTRYGDREYYGKVGKAISEEGQKINDYSNGDVTYYATGRSFAIFYAKEGESSQSGLIRMGKITSDLSDFEKIAGAVEMRIEVVK